MDMSRGGAPGSTEDMCRLRPRGIPGGARNPATDPAHMHVPRGGLGELGSPDLCSDNACSSRGSTVLVEKRDSARAQHWDCREAGGGAWPQGSSSTSINSPDAQ